MRVRGEFAIVVEWTAGTIQDIRNGWDHGEVSVERNAFSRARTFLSYTPTARWTALIASVLLAFIYLGLILIIALFADLLVYQGHIPAYTHIAPAQREAFTADWNSLPDTEREAATASLELRDPIMSKRVMGTDEIPMPVIELRWRAYVWRMLRDRVGIDAAKAYQIPPPEGSTISSADRIEELVRRSFQVGETLEDSRLHFGILSQVVRDGNHWTGPLLGWLASWNTWTWKAAGGQDANVRYLTGLFILTICLVLLRGLLLNLMNYTAALASLEAITRLRRAIYHHTYRLGTLAIRDLGPTEAVSLFTRHSESVHDGLRLWLTSTFRHPVLFALLLLLALTLHFWLAVTFIVFGLLVWLIGGQFLALSRQQSRIATRKAANRLVLLQESITMMRLVKCYIMELFNQGRVERQLAEYSKSSLKRFRSDSNSTPTFILLGSMGAVALLYIAGRIVLSEGFSVANLVTLTTLLVSLYFPVKAWLDSRRFMRRARESAATMFEFLDRKGEVPQDINAEFLPPLAKALEFADVSLREPGSGRMLLQNVNLSIGAGEKVCIVGPDDAEKHAFVYLIPRFLDPTGGEIRVDGKNIRWVTHESLRVQLAVVLQHNLVFNDTVANNIGCGDASYTLPQIIEAAKLAHAHQFISNLPNGYETPIGELGVSLRPGEQFRIALARAILRDPAILIIEEPHYAFDDDTKALVDDTLTRVMPNRTVIFLAHRATTIRKADRVILINQGRIEAQGDHRELLAEHQLYKHLHYLEFNAFADQV